MLSIFITGTNRGVGLAFVREYLARGEPVFAGCSDPEAAIERVQQETSSLDILINNAVRVFSSRALVSQTCTQRL